MQLRHIRSCWLADFPDFTIGFSHCHPPRRRHQNTFASFVSVICESGGALLAVEREQYFSSVAKDEAQWSSTAATASQQQGIPWKVYCNNFGYEFIHTTNKQQHTVGHIIVSCWQGHQEHHRATEEVVQLERSCYRRLLPEL